MARRELGPHSWRVAAAVEESVADEPADGLVVACSGGADSLALAFGAHHVAARSGRELRAVIIDHGLQSGSAEVAVTAQDQLHRIGFADVSVLPVQVVERGDGTEGAARRARYATLDRVAAETGGVVLLGHTLDDQAETVLLGLARGSGTRSLAGMPARRGPYRRPLLGLPRTITHAACTERGLIPWQDPHNDDPRYARVRARRHVLPELEEQLGPGIAAALARSADLARADADLLDLLAAEALERALDHGDHGLAVGVLAELAPALRGRVVRAWLLAGGAAEVTAVHVGAVAALVTRWRGQRGIDLPGIRVVRTGDRLKIDPGPAHL